MKPYDLFETEDGLQIQCDDEGPLVNDREAVIMCINDAFECNDEEAKDMIITLLMDRFE